MVIAIIAILLAILLPSLASAREAARAANCLANLRQMGLICQSYADENAGVGPAIGEPWGSPPNWALVIQQEAGIPGDDAALYRERSVLVCPTTAAGLRRGMTRTYAMNATGHAGAPGDPDNFDDAADPGHILFRAVTRPADRAVLVDSAVAFIPDNAPPPTRTSSTLDFRNASHVGARLGRVHAGGGFQAVRFDGSARIYADPPALWAEPLP